MAEFDFADRYAEAGLSPTADVITNRQATAARIVDEIDNKKILDLVACYYSGAGLDLGWMRDQFAQEDASFSLVNNARECRVLSAVLLGQLVSDGTDVAALAVAVGSLAGKRSPVDAPWLVQSSLRALAQTAIAEREAADVETKVNYTAVPKFAEEITAWPHGDWPALQAILGKMRTESQSSMRAMSTQATTALTALNLQLRLQREETQMLWWLFGGHSRSLERAFSSFDMPQAALVAAVDLACLTTVSNVGPIAVPAMLDRVICLARKPKAHASRTLESAVDGLVRDDLRRLPIKGGVVPPPLAPVTAAIELAKTIGGGAWHARFTELTGLSSSIEFSAVELGEQLYREHLLGQIL